MPSFSADPGSPRSKSPGLGSCFREDMSSDRPDHRSKANSRSWKKPVVLEQNKWKKTRNTILQLFPRSEVASWEMKHYLKHRAQVKDDELTAARRLYEKLGTAEDFRSPKTTVPILRGKPVMQDGRSMVLLALSVWAWNGLAPNRPQWPDFTEYKHEGDGRAATGFGRLLPVPRKPGDSSVNWSLRPFMLQFPFDRVAQHPTHPEDVFLDYDPVDEDESLHFVGSGLMDHIRSME